MWPIHRLREDWLVALPPDFAFLLSLPLLVALTGALRLLAQPSTHGPRHAAPRERRPGATAAPRR